MRRGSCRGGGVAGAGRRFEILGEFNGVTIADDYAHHPTELRATLTAAKAMGYDRVIAVFQPFTFSRTKLLLEIAGRTPERPVVPVAGRDPRVNCMIGEKIWQDRWGR